MPKNDYRSPEAATYRKLYKSSAWLKGRLVFLAQNPLCKRCLDAKRISDATIVHHIRKHLGDPVLFFDWRNWEPICAPCHDIDAQGEEARGFSKAIGADGWPSDARHPSNR